MTPTVRRRTLSMLSGLSVVVAVAACGSTDSSSTADDAAQADGTTQSADGTTGSASDGTDGTADSTTSGEAYTDGTYTAEGSYSSPGGEESIEVELTVSGDVVTAVTVTPEATSGNAQRFQEQFASAISDEVVGQDLSDLSVDKVSGSSLTGGGFNEALDQIRADAAV